MLSKLRLTLRQKIVVYCLIVLSPVVLLAYFLVDENSSYVKQQSIDRINSQANLSQLAIDELIGTWEKFLDNLAQTPAIRSRDTAASQQVLSAVFPLYSDFVTTLLVVDGEGRIVSGIQRGGSPSFTISDRGYFREVMRTGKPVVSGRIIGRSTDQPVFAVAAPVTSSTGSVVGAVVAGVSLRQIQALLDRIGEGAGDALVVDSDGVVLSHPNWRYVNEETDLRSLDPIGLALEGGQGTSEHSDPLEGDTWLWSYRPLARAPWAVVIKYPLTSVNAPMYTSILKWSFYLLAAIAVALALASFSAERIAQPLRRLTSRLTIEAPASNDKESTHAKVDDLHQLTRVFNEICESLAQTSNELAGVKEELAARARKLEMMTRQALEAREEERRRIAMNIHDGVLQLVGAAQMEARLARGSGPLPEVMAKRLGQVELVLEQALTDLRGISRGLCPPDLAEAGLVFAVYSHLIILRETYSIPRVSLYVSGEAYQLHAETENAAFRIVQEGLANAAKHAMAQVVEVFIDFKPDLLRLVVTDDGKGFNLKDVDGKMGDHFGLANMRERAAGVCGTCAILSMPEGGTRVEVEVPV